MHNFMTRAPLLCGERSILGEKAKCILKIRAVRCHIHSECSAATANTANASERDAVVVVVVGVGRESEEL